MYMYQLYLSKFRHKSTANLQKLGIISKLTEFWNSFFEFLNSQNIFFWGGGGGGGEGGGLHFMGVAQVM